MISPDDKNKLKTNDLHYYFEPALPSQRDMIYQWLHQPYINEWLHGVGLQNTLEGLEKFYLETSGNTYWIGYYKGIPFAFLITSPECEGAITLDLFICDPLYLGKGLSVPMIRNFLTTHFSQVTKVLIDPEVANARAVHIYQKVGFRILKHFIASWHPVPHYQMELHMADLLNPKDEVRDNI